MPEFVSNWAIVVDNLWASVVIKAMELLGFFKAIIFV
jgi:hypothetical protein